MSYDAVDRVIKSSIEEPGEFCVLLALAHCFNAETGECFPSTATIAKLARKSPRVVRQAIQALEQRGIISCKQSPGGVRRFTLSFDAIPLSETQPLSKTQGGTKTTVLPETTVHPCRKGQGTPAENARGPLSKTTAEQGIEQVSKQVTEQVFISRTSSTSAEKQNASLPDDVPAWVIDQQSSDSYSEASSTSGGSSVSDCGSAVSSREDTFELTPNEPPKPAPKAKPKTSRRKPKISCPFTPGDALSDDLLSWAVENYPTIDARAEFQNFINSALANDRRYSDWNAAFRNWCGNALRYQNQNGGNSARQPYKRDTTRFAHEWRQEDRVYGSEEGLKEMLAYLEEHGEKISA